MKTSFSDRIRSLQYESERAERRKILNEPHIKPLTEFVLQIRKERRLRDEIPFFDPCDGGINGEVLFLLEAAGPKAIESGFISRNNNDPTAENMFRYLKKAELLREDTILWNIVPWYLGTGDRIKPASIEDIKNGSVYLERLLLLLEELQVIAFVGSKSQQAIPYIEIKPSIKILSTFHPSNQNKAYRPETEEKIIKAFQEITAFLKK